LASLVILQPDARAEARLGDALGGIHHVSFVRSWPELLRVLGRETLDGCVVDADYPNREEAVTEIRRLRKRHANLALVAYADMHENDLELYRFGGLGVNGVVLARRPPWASGIRTAIERALASSRADRVRGALEGLYEPSASAAVAWAVENAERKPRVDTFAAAQGRSTRELALLLRLNRLPPPGRLLMWGRLLRAGAYLSKDERTVEDTALHLGYSSASALARAMKRETGVTPSDVARRGGLPFVHARLFHTRPSRYQRNGAMTLTLALLAFWQAGCATLGAGAGLSNVNSLSEYPVGKHGREVVFTLLSNGSGLPSSRVRAAPDDVTKVLAGIRP